MTSAVPVALILATLMVVWGAPPNPCYRAQMPNNDDPYSFYKCDASGRPHLWRCAAGTMYDRRTEICDWEDQVRSRNGQTGQSGTSRQTSGGNRGTSFTRAGPIGGGYRDAAGRAFGTGGGSPRYGYGGGGYKDKDKIACYVANVDWDSIAKTAAYAYHKVKPILDSMQEDYHYDKYDKYGKDKYDKYDKDDKYHDSKYYKDKQSSKGKGKYQYEESEEDYDLHDLPHYGSGDSSSGRRPNRQPGPLDSDYDNGEDWEEYEAWRDQFRDRETGSGSRDTGRNPGRDTGRDTSRESRRVDCTRSSSDGAPQMFQNPDDCSTYFTCNMRRPVLTYCPRGLRFNPRRQGCDDSDPPGCRNVRGSQTPNDVFIYQRRSLITSEN